MLKKLTLCAALSACTLATAGIHLDFTLAINETETNYQRHVQGSLTIENEEPVIFDKDELVIEYATIQKDEEGVTLSCAIIKLDDQDENNNEEDNAIATLLAQPIVNATWNQPASIRLANEKGDSIEFVITASQTN